MAKETVARMLDRPAELGGASLAVEDLDGLGREFYEWGGCKRPLCAR